MFSEGREDVNDEERARRPSTSTTDEKINEVEKIILANRRITVREVAEDLNISIGSCHSIFINDLGMRRVAAKFVPKLLNCDQKQHRMNIANEMLDSVRDDSNLLQRVITGDENWPPCDFFLFPKLKRPMKGRRYASLDEIKTASKEELKNILKNDFLKTAAATHHQQEPHKPINLPPYPCKICASHQLPNQIHFHRDCPLKNNTHPKRINPEEGVTDEAMIIMPVVHLRLHFVIIRKVLASKVPLECWIKMEVAWGKFRRISDNTGKQLISISLMHFQESSGCLHPLDPSCADFEKIQNI
ncbi:hypothetical protein LAZ67_X002792 [Cordylochernes scorpioides]|uniref:Uncharacterized protein n=1 Tax=Cordylochernes scorpioides TaxID=51811 RepID=A0ABY6LXU9_9ARAC|nr:hypothetical protein LAZ67_X002792 [Cordylochernes scorpioides]